jgi:multicomponent Na+:H+ antiporter subunit E
VRRLSPVWALTCALVWWILAAPRTDAWVAGVIAVALAVAIHTALGGRRDPGIRPLALPAFVPFFLWQSVRGGLDVARRAFAPSLPLAPGFIDYRVGLPEGPARVFFVNCISLLPGTFSADLQGRALRVHLLTDDGSGHERLVDLEARVGRLFGTPVSETSPEPDDG